MGYEDWVVRHARVASKPHRRLTLDDTMSFFHQLATLIGAGMPLLQAVQVTGRQSESLGLRQILGEVADRIAAGSPFHTAAANYPRVFDPAWLEMIRTGEITGKMGQVLLELDRQVHEARDARRKIRGAMTYPVILLAVAVLAVTAMLWFVVPTFTKMFREMGTELPGITRLVIGASDLVTADGPYLVAVVVAAAVALRRYLRTDDGRRRVLGLMLVLPTAGDLLVQSAMYRFASNLALLLKSGVPMLETLEALRNILGHNPMYRDAMERARRRVAGGQSLAAALEESGLFTGMIVSMVRTGEESGQLGPVMEQIAPYYREGVEMLTTRIAKLMEPVIIIGMGLIVGTMVLSIYMPMFEMSGKIK